MKKTSPKLCFFLLPMLFASGLNAQNIVPNYSFETYSSCPTNTNQLNLVDEWYKPTNYSSDYFNSCYVPPTPYSVDIPDNYFGSQETLTGEGYTGVITYVGGGNPWKEYLQVLLTEPLIVGECYEVEMFSSLAEGSDWATNGLGIYLSDTPPPIAQDGHIYLTPTFYYTDIHLDSENWVPLNGTYTAIGGEQYLTIGQFFEYGTIDVTPNTPPGGVESLAYYYIEDVSVELLSLEEEIKAEICEGECYEYEGEQYCEVGVYEIPIEGACFSTVTLTIDPAEVAIADIAPSENLDCNTYSLILDASGSSSGPDVYYDWTGPGNYNSSEQSPTVFEPGIYNLTVSGDSLCPTSVSIELFQDITPPDVSTEVSGDINCFTPIVTLTGISNTQNVTFHWSGPGVDTNDPIIFAYESGVYTLTVTGENDCTNTEEVNVLEDLNPPDIFAEAPGILDCNTSFITLTGTSNTPNVNYHWFGPGVYSNLPVVITNQAGTYTLTVTGENGCTSSEEVEVLEDLNPPDIFAESLGILDCNTPSVVLSGSSNTPGVTYLWSGPGVDTDVSETSTDQAGDYTFIVFAPNGCVSTTNVTVLEDNTPLDIDAIAEGIINCEDTTVTLTGSTNTPNVSYQWSGPGLSIDSAIVQVSEAGDYTFTIMTGSGCTTDTTISVEQNNEEPDIIILSPDTLNCNTLTTQLDASSSTGTGVLSFEWQDIDGNILGMDSLLNVDFSGTYSLILIDGDNGCSEQSTVDVFEDVEGPNAIADAIGILSCNNDTVTLDGSNSSGNLLNFQWLDPNDDEISEEVSVEVSIEGTYSLYLTNSSNGCTSITTIEVESDFETPIVVAETTDTLNCDINQITLDGDGSSEGNNFSYEWLDPANSSISNSLQFDVENPGLYTLIVTNNINGCSSSASVELFQNNELPQADAGLNQLLNCEITLATLDGSNSTGFGTLTFEWLDPNDLMIGDTEIIEVEIAGIYTLVVTAGNGCTHEAQIDVTQDIENPVADAGANGILTCDVSEATLNGSNSTGSNLSFQWFDQNTQLVGQVAVVQVSQTGTYTLLVTNEDNGCTAEASVNVIPDADLPTAIIEPVGQLNCQILQVTLDGSNSSSVNNNSGFEWFDELGNSISFAEQVNVSNPGFFTLVVTDLENGCTHEAQIDVTQDIENPVADAGANGILTCDVSEATLDGSNSTGSNLSFQWFDQNTQLVGQVAVVQVSQTGTYTLLVTNEDNGCTAEASVNVIPDADLPAAIIEPVGQLNCQVLQVILDGSNSSSVNNNSGFEWFDELGNSISFAEQVNVSNPGIFTLVVTDLENGCTHEAQIDVTQNIETPVADAGANGILTCDVSEATLDGSNSTGSNLSFQWFDQNTQLVGQVAVVQVSQTGTYTLLVTNEDNGCTAEASVNVIPDADLPTAIIEPVGQLNCQILQVTLDGSNSSSVNNNSGFEWFDELGNSISFAEQVNVSNPGIFTLVVTDLENGCTHEAQIDVTQDIENPVADAGANGILTCDVSEATLNGSNSTGSNLSFQWFDQNTQLVGQVAVVQVSQTGTYTLIVTNEDNGCTAEAFVNVIPDADLPAAIIEPVGQLNCQILEITLDGSNSSSVNNNSGFEWFDELGNSISFAEQVNVSNPGIFTLVVTDLENGCTHEAQIDVTQDIENPVADAGANGILTCDVSEATLNGSNSTGSNLSFQWFDQNTQLVGQVAVVQVSQTGTYTLIVTNEDNGCTAEAFVNVIPDADLPMAIIEPVGQLNCQILEITLDGSNSSSVNNNSGFEWFDELGNSISFAEQVNVSNPGIFTLVVTDIENGCTHEAQIDVDQDIENPVADAGANGILTCDVSEATLNGSNSTGSNLSFQWFDQNTQLVGQVAVVQVSQTGTYTLIVTNEDNGCTAEASVNVIPDADLPAAIIEPVGQLNCQILQVTLDGSNSSSVNNNSGFEWFDELGNSISFAEQVNVSNPGFFTLVVTDLENGCTHEAQIDVTQDIENPVADAGANGILTCDVSQATLDGSNSTGSNLSFQWFDQNTQLVGEVAVVQVSQTGTYTLLVTNEDNGCTAEASVNVIPDADLPAAIIEPVGQLNCQVLQVTLDGSNSSSVNNNSGFEWFDELGNSISFAEQVNVSNPGIYTLVVTDIENGCTHEAQIDVTQDIETPSAIIDESSPLSIDCNTSSLILDGNASSPFGNINFEWSTNNGNIFSDGDTPNPEINQAGTYYLTITNLSNFCTDMDSIFIGDNFTSPIAIIEEAALLTCSIVEIALDGNGSSVNGDFAYSWTSTPPGGFVSGENTLEPIINQAGTYTLTVLNNDNGCVAEAEINVGQDINPPTAVANAEDEFDCVTETVMLSGSGSSEGSDFIYLWTGIGAVENEFSLSPIVYQAGDYDLLVTNLQNGCTASVTVTAIENTNAPNAFNYEMLAPPCFGDMGSIEIFLVIGGEAPYLFSIDDGENFSQQSYFSLLEPGDYTIIVQDAIGCEFEEVISVPSVSEVQVALEAEVILNLGDNYQLDAQTNIPVEEIDTIIWFPTQMLSCLNCLNPQVDAILEMAQYSITVVNLNGCRASDEIILRVKKTREVFIPNVFSPINQDGVNDIFMIYANNDKIKQINSFQIFDRWGEVVFRVNHFQANDPDYGWDGRLRNEKLNPGVFVYLAEIEFIDGVKKIYSGDVTLVD